MNNGKLLPMFLVVLRAIFPGTPPHMKPRVTLANYRKTPAYGCLFGCLLCFEAKAYLMPFMMRLLFDASDDNDDDYDDARDGGDGGDGGNGVDFRQPKV